MFDLFGSGYPPEVEMALIAEVLLDGEDRPLCPICRQGDCVIHRGDDFYCERCHKVLKNRGDASAVG